MAVSLNDEQKHKLSVAFVTVIQAVRGVHEAKAVGAHDQAILLAETLQFGLARQGFVVSYEPMAAARLAAEFEREDGGRMT